MSDVAASRAAMVSLPISPRAACGASKGFTSDYDPVLGAGGQRSGQEAHSPRGGLPPVGRFRLGWLTVRHVRGVHNRAICKVKRPQTLA